ncbi:MAG: hypothetical protein QXH25_05020, partial [Acidilobaceae archaeon]
MKIVKVTIAGFGGVGRSFVKAIAVKQEELAKRYEISIKIVGVADSKGIAIKRDGFTPYELMKMV